MPPAPEPLVGAFNYPDLPHVRRHLPRGYLDDEHYKPWLRDEFSFRCVYCCCREAWFPDGAGSFSVEHVVPTSLAPEGLTRHEALLYACSQCNSLRGTTPLPLDPCGGLRRHLTVQTDGTVRALTPAGDDFIAACRLNRSALVNFRRMMLDVLAFLRTRKEKQAAALASRYLGYPEDLPDLTVLRPPGGNECPEGILQSALQRRRRGELPPTY
jgi:hypothetical protein